MEDKNGNVKWGHLLTTFIIVTSIVLGSFQIVWGQISAVRCESQAVQEDLNEFKRDIGNKFEVISGKLSSIQTEIKYISKAGKR